MPVAQIRSAQVELNFSRILYLSSAAQGRWCVFLFNLYSGPYFINPVLIKGNGTTFLNTPYGLQMALNEKKGTFHAV